MLYVKNLSFSYHQKPFIEDMSFEVKKGEIFGFLGPSGAGKSTLQKILTGQIITYQGQVKLNNMECKEHDSSFYENIGIDFEFSTLYEKLTARQNLTFFRTLYSKKGEGINTLLSKVGLQNDADKKVSDYSKGMRSRLNFIKALLHDPDILFLDEPTSGLDPTNSKIMKELILKEKENGKTIFITTHNMQDASELCDRVAFIVDGNIKALDTPHNLIMSKGATKLTYTFNDMNEIRKTILLSETSTDKLLSQLLKDNKLTSIHSSEPTLNDIFIEITGRTLK
ncbi:MAG: ATP-binding cassette domain-containing protein [Coprobacillaceae bacterium]